MLVKMPVSHENSYVGGWLTPGSGFLLTQPLGAAAKAQVVRSAAPTGRPGWRSRLLVSPPTQDSCKLARSPSLLLREVSLTVSLFTLITCTQCFI